MPLGRRNHMILALLVVAAAVTLSIAQAAAASPPSTPTYPPATPAPPTIDWNSIKPGEWKIVAVLPPGGSQWLQPGVGQGAAYSSSTYGMTTVAGGSTGSSTGPATATVEYGCTADLRAPIFKSDGSLIGSVYWHNCINVLDVEDTVGMQKSGAVASFWNTTWGFDGQVFTAWSAPFTNCVFVDHQWRTLDQAQVWSVYGGSTLYAGSSPYVSRYC